MKDETRRAALRAAHAVALGTIAAACTSTTASTPAPGEKTNAAADCMALTDGAFPGVDGYPYPKAKASPHPAVQQCCRQSLEAFFSRRTPDPVMERHRWACCASVDTSGARELGAACTPWGPPVPPAYGARRSRSARGGELISEGAVAHRDGRRRIDPLRAT